MGRKKVRLEGGKGGRGLERDSAEREEGGLRWRGKVATEEDETVGGVAVSIGPQQEAPSCC